MRWVGKASGGRGKAQALIRAVPRKGVRFVGVVQEERRLVPSDKAGTSAAANTMVESTVTLGQPSIAVLPFQNMSVDSEQEYFADGVAEEIIIALSRRRSFSVIARSSSFV